MSQRGGSQSAGDSGGESKRDLKRRMDEALQALSSLELSPGEPVMDPKKPPGKLGNVVKLDTNVYGIKKGAAIAYRYDVTITGVLRGGRQGERVVEFTKRTREDAVVVDRKDKSRIAFAAFVRCFPQDFGPDPTALYYDLQSVLYTLQQLNLVGGNDKTFTLQVNQLEDAERDAINISTLDRIDMLVKKVSSHFEVALDDHSAITDDVSRIDHSLLTFLELATSQYALFTPSEHVSYGGGKTFLLSPENHGFTQNDCPQLKNGHYLAVGAEKSCRFFEGPKMREGKGVGLIVQTTKAPFHMADQTLIDKAAAILVNPNVLLGQGHLEQRDIQTLNKQMKTLHCNVLLPNNRTREIRVHGVVGDTANQRRVTIEGMGEVTIAQYYTQRYSTNELYFELRYPDAPLVTVHERQRVTYFPMELCFVKDNQRVTIAQQERRDIATMIRKCAIPPPMLKQHNANNANAMHLHDSAYLANAGIEVIPRTLKVPGRQLPPPSVQYGEGGMETINATTGNWRQGNKKYLVPASCKVWAAYMVTVRNNRRDRFTWEMFEAFLKHFHKQCRAKGMDMPPPADYAQLDGTADDLQAKVELCMRNNVEYILFVTDEAIKNLHNFMKRWEINSGIVTQDINSGNAYEIVSKHKVQTLENIVNKTNIKLGGLNYSIVVDHAGLKKAFAETLFIGLGMSHPAAQTAHERARDAMSGVPSVTGYAANFKRDPFDFVGDFVFDEPRRDEKYPVVSTIVENCVKRYVENRNEPPKRLVIFRNGTSEGQFASILRFEVPFIRNALQQSGAPECRLTLLVPQKMHKVRIFPETEVRGGNPAENNIKPGTVIDTSLVHPMYNEFYLNSHQAIQGSAKTPRYTVLVDENEFPMDIIESITYDLSFSHQIVTLATSLPSPAYIALEYAKRGRNNYSVFRQEGAQNDPDIYLPDGSLNYEHISNRLNYSQVPSLRNKRVNA